MLSTNHTKTKFNYYLEVAGLNFAQHVINSGTTQGSILGPILYAIYVATLFDLTDLSNFADNNFILTTHKNKNLVIAKMEMKLKIIKKWLRTQV